jgi:hypothetical protein
VSTESVLKVMRQMRMTGANILIGRGGGEYTKVFALWMMQEMAV